MDQKNVRELIDKMRKDAAFRGSVLEIDNIDQRMAFLAEAGYDCKINDIQHYLRHYVGKDGDQAVFLTEKKGCNGIYYGFCF